MNFTSTMLAMAGTLLMMIVGYAIVPLLMSQALSAATGIPLRPSLVLAFLAITFVGFSSTRALSHVRTREEISELLVFLFSVLFAGFLLAFASLAGWLLAGYFSKALSLFEATLLALFGQIAGLSISYYTSFLSEQPAPPPALGVATGIEDGVNPMAMEGPIVILLTPEEIRRVLEWRMQDEWEEDDDE